MPCENVPSEIVQMVSYEGSSVSTTRFTKLTVFGGLLSTASFAGTSTDTETRVGLGCASTGSAEQISSAQQSVSLQLFLIRHMVADSFLQQSWMVARLTVAQERATIRVPAMPAVRATEFLHKTGWAGLSLPWSSQSQAIGRKLTVSYPKRFSISIRTRRHLNGRWSRSHARCICCASAKNPRWPCYYKIFLRKIGRA